MPVRLFIGLLFILVACAPSVYIAETSLAYERVSDETVSEVEELNELISPYRRELSSIMDKVIGTLEIDMIKELPESNIGNWLADMLFEEARYANKGQLDFAVQNYGGIRVVGLGKGPLTVGEIYEVMPFDNLVTIISANGNITKTFLDHIAKDRGWPVSRSLRFAIKDQVATNILLNDQPLDPDRIYHFAVPDYIASGGSGSIMLAEGKRHDLPLLVRDAFIDHIKKDAARGEVQSAEIDGRIINLDNE